jgi:hypothetical protein
MAENSPEDAAADTRELKDAVLEALEAKGVLSQVGVRRVGGDSPARLPACLL